ncbi:MAG TPA: isocitrate lyase/phosphoenolpyruvate mutase family protein [Dinghuibacter sp.]|uniref:isocitrate lyase/PEP mutase family protein n=1 Tax=Dinghuibacter sp. TaxID=2024697 RepID=UPI002CF5D1D4|nr:isocitrate lyase/phosphoenolpyruvate mutase family protein [Dinghuibacter sp.]HTJ11543.1 isocitrate lyase/phosphoenolpyruvate mutase family protein [Dinghuibacter sp.]
MNHFQRFNALHRSGKLLLLPNIWDAAGARMLEALGYPAVATASFAVARAHGYEDGEKIPFDKVCWLVSRIVASVGVPVTADIEAGYARTLDGLRQNIRMLVDTGASGINFEDSDPASQSLLSIEDQTARIRAIRAEAPELYINARVDVYVRPCDNPLSEALSRARAYLEAGASGIFPVGAVPLSDVGALVAGIAGPVNISLGAHDLRELERLGVARVSMGPGFQTRALDAMKNIALGL